MIPISVCIIAKNEELNIENCLKPLRKFDWEIIVVDTGSNDNTKEIAARYADKVLHYTWTKDFSAARNYSIEQASHDLILVIDCDETLMDIDIEAILALAQEHPQHIGLLSRQNHYEMNGTDSVYVDLVERLFSRKYYHYSGIIHEQVVLKEPFQQGAPVQGAGEYQIPLTLDHCGYNGSEEELLAKAQRNIELLQTDLKNHPDNPYTYFQLGQSYNMIHDDENACLYYGKGLSYDIDPAAEYVQMMVIGYGYALLHLNREEEALGLSGVYDAFDSSADFVSLMGLIYLRNGQYMKALLEFIKATTFQTAHVTGANTFIPSYNIGLINEMMGEKEMALVHYRKCGDFPMALERIKELEK
ncbi:MAG: glycosyltransferase [Roseburia sp.]|nr:glycosyltransferase [Roseburia sp.]MCM1242752.1 glycosyltransferase [Roseburia sp.]